MMLPLVEATGITRHFVSAGGAGPFRPKRVVRAVDGVDLTIAAGETLGLVGESGSGKSTLARVLIGAVPASAGRVRFAGEDVTRPRPARWRALRREMQLIQQNPAAALDPRMPVGDQLVEALALQRLGARAERPRTAARMLDLVGLDARLMERFPHELSGGQLQRVAIARALLVRPRFVVCDEPVSALDLSVQAQVINLLRDLQAEFGLTYLFVSHDLGVVRHLSDRIAVLYLGRIVEIGPVESVLGRPRHPYTRALLAAVPVPDPFSPPPAVQLCGEPPDAAALPAGCRFRARCLFASEACAAGEPALTGTVHRVACHFPRMEAVP